MNDKLQYAEMLEIPVNSCNITVKPSKRKKQKKNTRVSTRRYPKNRCNSNAAYRRKKEAHRASFCL